jgi:hypothetical protein
MTAVKPSRNEKGRELQRLHFITDGVHFVKQENTGQ